MSEPTTFLRLGRAAWWYAIRRAVREFLRDRVIDKAATLTYYAVLSLFPALIALVSLLGPLGQAEVTTERLMGLLGDFLPAEVLNLLRGPISSIAGSPAAGWGLVSGLLVALWTASNYVAAFARSANGIYEVPEGRPIWKRRAVLYGLTGLLVVSVAVAALMLALTGPVARAVGSLVGIGEATVQLWDVVKWPVIVLIAVVLVATLYHWTPNAIQPRFRWISPGSAFALLGAAVASLGFAFYVRNFASYNATYGALAGVVVFLVWLWVMNIVLLAGMEIDVELERARELCAGLPAGASLQLPLRDTAQVDKDAATYQRLLDEGLRLTQR